MSMEENGMGGETALDEDRTSTDRKKRWESYIRPRTRPQGLEESPSMDTFPLAACSKPNCSGKGAPHPLHQNSPVRAHPEASLCDLECARGS